MVAEDEGNAVVSEYGRFWELAEGVRRRIKELLPRTTANTPAETRADAKWHAHRVEELIVEWGGH
jgi:hypothetical protein